MSKVSGVQGVWWEKFLVGKVCGVKGPLQKLFLVQ